MARKPKKLKEIKEILNGRTLDEIENVDICVLKEMRETISEISDPRDEAYVRHNLADIIMITFFAVLAEADEWLEIEVFAKKKKEWLKKFLELNYGIPTDDTYRRVLAMLNINYIYSLVISFLIKKAEKIIETFSTNVIEEKETLSCDGKVSNASKRQETDVPGEKPLNTLNAYSSNWGVCLDQEFIEEKTNEITAMPTLLNRLNLNGVIVTWDALNTQKAITEAVISGGGDYIGALKKNHKCLYEDVKEYFSDEIISEIKKFKTKYKKTVDKEHSGIVKREYFLEDKIDWLYGKEEWEGIKSIGFELKTIKKNNPKIPTKYEVRYFITSIDNIEDFSVSVRAHWGVENGLHWQLDFTFEDDKNTTTRNNGAEALQLFKKLALALLKLAQVSYPKRTSIKIIRYRLALDFDNEIEKIFTMMNVDAIRNNFYNN